jgi:RecJ-like exonuclease
VDPGLTGFLNEKKVNKGCKECEGEGHTETKCKKCVFGKCYNCKGQGGVEYRGLKGVSKDDKENQKEKAICNVCHGTGKCLKCKGTGSLDQDCSHCKQGMVLNKNSILKEMLKSLQNISKETDSNISTKSITEVKTSQELDSLFNQSVKKTIEQTDGNEQINPLEESEIQKAFKKAKAYIEDYELKSNKDICEEISLKYIDKIPALVLDLSDGYVQKIDSTKVREVSGFKKYWEDQAVIQGYDKEVATILMHNGVKVNDKFTLSEKYKRVK